MTTVMRHRASRPNVSRRLPGHIWAREKVYLAWLGITSVGIVGIAASIVGWSAGSALLLALYGALGFDGLGHYALALCSEHTVAANLSIWLEVVAGAALLAASAWHLKSRVGEAVRA
jgi:hypothetical protein